MRSAAVTGSFDDLRSRHVRLLEEASKLGPVRAFVWPDEAVEAWTGAPPRFPAEERLYTVGALRYVRRAALGTIAGGPHALAGDVAEDGEAEIWAVAEGDDHPAKRAFCESRGIEYRLIPEAVLGTIEASATRLEIPPPAMPAAAGARAERRKRVIVTGCYDWFHSGHVRFFEEASAYGDLYVDVGSDANIRLLKGRGHPLFPQGERLYMVRSVRHVAQAFIGTGKGWMDAAPEIEILGPDFYVVNEDGDRPEKRAFCEARGIAYVVLARAPRPGLPRRDSTTLRGY